MPKATAAEARATRARILEAAMDTASVEGLEGLSIGGLARRLDMSKSGVIGHFASKQDLQLETVKAAEAVFEDAVLSGLSAEPGLARLREMLGRWLDHVDSGRLQTPMLMMQSGCDRLVDPAAPARWAENAPAGLVESVLWEDLYHEMFNEPEKGQVRSVVCQGQ